MNTGEFNVLRRFWRDFLLWSFGCFLLYSAYGTLLNLQSSINVVDGLGASSVTITYATSAIVSLLCAPLLLRKFGAKKCICASEVTYIVYMIANFYPVIWTLGPTSFILGIGDCIVWSVFPIFNSHFAKKYAALEGTSPNSSEFSGYFYAIFQCAKIFGNLVSFSLLYTFSITNPSGNISTNYTLSYGSNMTSSNTNITSRDMLLYENVTLYMDVTSTLANTTSNDRNLYCGAHDCQNPVDVRNTITQYTPSADIARYSLLALMVLLCICALIIHIVFLPKTCGEEFAGKSTGNNSRLRTFIWKGLKDCFRQLFSTQQLLVTSIIFYAGLQYAFIICELTRAFSSCIFGLSWVPIHMTAYGLSACLIAYIIGKLGKSVGQDKLLCFAAILDVAGYAYCLLAEPDSISFWMLFLLFFTMGGVQGIWLVMTNVVQITYFPDRLDVAGPIWSIWYICGVAVQFGWSTSLCVSTKVYIQLGILSFCMLTYAIAEIRYHKLKRLENHNIKVDNQKHVEQDESTIKRDELLLSGSEPNCSQSMHIS